MAIPKQTPRKAEATPKPKRIKDKDDQSVRPYRLRDSTQAPGHDLLYRYYMHPTKAHMGAIIESRWAPVGTVIEVWNINTGEMLGQYKRGVSSIIFMR